MTASTATTPTLFAYPEKATFGRVLPKNKIYAHAKPCRRVRDHFTSEVAQIVWHYKLAPETINLPANASVPEIQIFTITLKPEIDDLNEDVLRSIDKAIAFPIFYEVIRQDSIRVAASYKRPSDSNPAKWVVGDYFGIDWQPIDTPRAPLPVALNLGSLYEQMLRKLMPLPARPNESLKDHVCRLEQVRAKQNQIGKIQAHLLKEKQFNRKVERNSQLHELQTELEHLTA